MFLCLQSQVETSEYIYLHVSIKVQTLPVMTSVWSYYHPCTKGNTEQNNDLIYSHFTRLF